MKMKPMSVNLKNEQEKITKKRKMKGNIYKNIFFY